VYKTILGDLLSTVNVMQYGYISVVTNELLRINTTKLVQAQKWYTDIGKYGTQSVFWVHKCWCWWTAEVTKFTWYENSNCGHHETE